MEYIIDIDEEDAGYTYHWGDGRWTLDGKFTLRELPGWIDVEDKEPCHGQDIMVCDIKEKSENIWHGWIGDYEIANHTLDNKMFTHWMPLPKHIRMTSGNEV